MRLDHLSYAAGPEGLGACAQRLGALLGASFSDGGIHPRFGTRNFILPLAGHCYLEVVTALDHPSVDNAPFGRAVRDRTAAGGGWFSWVVGVSQLEPIEARFARAAAQGHRVRPDGYDLRWKQIGINDTANDPQLPWFIHWETDVEHHPSAGGGQISLENIEIAGDRDRVVEFLGDDAARALDDLHVTWLPIEDNEGETGIVAATFLTPRGVVRID